MMRIRTAETEWLADAGGLFLLAVMFCHGNDLHLVAGEIDK
jgi:hypothetical protein